MNGRVVVGALLSMLFSIAAVEARGPYGSINVGNWKGGAYTNDQTAAFFHCVAGAGYDSGIYFMVLIDQSSTWSLGFQHPKWSFTNNQQFPIALTFDGQSPFYVQGVAVSESLVRVPMPTDSALIGQFRKAKAMTAFTEGPAVSIQARSDRAVAAHFGELCRGREATAHRQRRRLLL
jgi:hypothetical protein